MKFDKQCELIDRALAYQEAGKGEDTYDTQPSSFKLPASHYTSHDRFKTELRMFKSEPTVVGLSGLLPEPGTYATTTIGNTPILLTRDKSGTVSAMLNICKHRGTQLASGRGKRARLVCPYHAWSYDLNGNLLARTGERYFDDREAEGLTLLPVTEQHGLIWVIADPEGKMPEDLLQGLEDELISFDLESYRLTEQETSLVHCNWKLLVDSYCEVYHVPALHAQSLAPHAYGNYTLWDTYGYHGRIGVVRKSIVECKDQKREDWVPLDHLILGYHLRPNVILIYQQDHFELNEIVPGKKPSESIIKISLYAPKDSARDDAYWHRNFKVLWDITIGEDFVACASIHEALESNALEFVTFGRNEPGLQHFHKSLALILENYSGDSDRLIYKTTDEQSEQGAGDSVV